MLFTALVQGTSQTSNNNSTKLLLLLRCCCYGTAWVC